MDINSVGISENGYKVLATMRRPASPSDRPGDRLDSGLARDFGAAAIDQLVNAGLIQRGGTPSPVPKSIAAMYPFHMAEHHELMARWAAKGTPLYPAAQDILFLTEAGWDFPIPEDVVIAPYVPDPYFAFHPTHESI